MSHSKSLTAANAPCESQRRQSKTQALNLMREALALLDEIEAPDAVGAHLDLAINRLQEWLDTED